MTISSELHYLIKQIETEALNTGHTFRMCRIGVDFPGGNELIAELHEPYEKLAKLIDELVKVADKAEVQS